ncbi:MAG TPA: hypothetical protein VFZ08_00960 [Terriglobia bacterium]|nr:hypothetical protein [Terriglobia bacterium]
MQPSQDVFHLTRQTALSKAAPNPVPVSLVLPLPQQIGWKSAISGRVEVLPFPPSSPRCSEKGCVFPATPGAAGMCLHHYRQTQEPILFSSHQPTRVVLDRGRFGVPEEVDASRAKDRRRLAEIREAFLED